MVFEETMPKIQDTYVKWNNLELSPLTEHCMLLVNIVVCEERPVERWCVIGLVVKRLL